MIVAFNVKAVVLEECGETRTGFGNIALDFAEHDFVILDFIHLFAGTALCHAEIVALCLAIERQAVHVGEEDEGATEEEDEDRPLSDVLVRDLTAHRTLGLRLNLSEQSKIAIVAVTHALAAQIFYLGADADVVGIQPVKTGLAAHADGIEDTPGRQGLGGSSRRLGEADAPADNRLHSHLNLE